MGCSEECKCSNCQNRCKDGGGGPFTLPKNVKAVTKSRRSLAVRRPDLH